jgi:reductive dehalogenase
MRLFSYKDRPVHLGPYPLERLRRTDTPPDLSALPPMRALRYDDPADPESLAHAMARFAGMFDVVRDGPVVHGPGDVPDDPRARADHLKAAGHYFDATMMATCALPEAARLAEPIRNPMVAALAAELERSQPKSFAAGIDAIVADVIDSARMAPAPIDAHRHAIVCLVEWPRDPRDGERGGDWIRGIQPQRAAILAAQTAVLLASYLRLLGHPARSHTASCSDVDLARLAVAAGLAIVGRDADGTVHATNPYLGRRFGLAAVTTTLELAHDAPLAADRGAADRWRSHGPAWWVGHGTAKSALNREPYADREFRLGAYPFESIPRRAEPTTFIDHARVPRFPKRADFFARALFGDLGKDVQQAAKNGMYVLKSPIGACARRALGALLLLQFGDARGPVSPSVADPSRNADNLKAAAHWLGVDAVGLCAVPEWAWYSHDSAGNPLPAYHANGVNLLLDQGHETMEGASGDDWISVAQSMRAYLRFSLLGGILAEQIRRLGYSARVHSVIDGEVLQPPLLLLSGLGEVSRIGEVILNPYLGPRLKSGTVTTDLPMAHDAPIDFGLQRFCESCSKCARECPSGAITAGPKRMYNGYEIWKSDAEKCARYRITNAAGGMCGRCMKTCPWNLEGLLAESIARQVAMKVPASAPWLARLDDALGRGGIVPVKKWWWDVELDPAAGRYVRAPRANARGIQPDLVVRPEDQTLAVYPADTMPPPWPVAHPVDRERGIERYRTLLAPDEYRRRLAAGETEGLAPPFRIPDGPPPVFPVVLARREEMAEDLARYEFASADGSPLPAWDAGAHVDVVIAPEYNRQYSLAGDPADRSRYVLGVLREANGRGGSALMHRVFREGRRVFVSPPRNHFPLDERASHVLLMAGGIGVTPMVAMAHRLHAIGGSFELHYSVASRAQAGFLDDLARAPWRERVRLHVKDEGGRADLAAILPAWREGVVLYACGSARYMDGVYDAARARGFPDRAMHREYFSVPEAPERERHPFVVVLGAGGRRIEVGAEENATDALARAGVRIDTKCSDGLCGVCARPYLAGEVDHRDLVLSTKERAGRIVLCCSRAARPGGEIVLDLPR